MQSHEALTSARIAEACLLRTLGSRQVGLSRAMNSHATLPGRLCKHPPTRPRIASPIPSRKGGGTTDTGLLASPETTNPDSLRAAAQAHEAQRACCWKSVSLGHEALPGITWYLLQCRVRPGNPGLLAPAQSLLSQGKKGLGQKAAEIGRVKYCCRGNVARHTSRCLAPLGCTVFLPITYLRLPDCNLSSPFGTFAPGDPDPQPCSAAEPSSSGTPGTAEAQPILAPKPI